jgi:hypothetical protein
MPGSLDSVSRSYREELAAGLLAGNRCTPKVLSTGI